MCVTSPCCWAVAVWLRSCWPRYAPASLGPSAPAVLPLLSHTLDQAWRSRTGETLTLADYERTGGIDGAVAASAERAYNALTPAQRATARQVFQRLTATNSDACACRRRPTR